MTALPWFRLYHRTIDDAKIKLLAFEDRWHFVALCCLTANGTLAEADDDLKSRMVAVALGVQLRELDEIKRRLMAVNLIGADLVPLAWDDLQFQSDTSTPRVQKFREKQRRNKVKRCGNVTVTVQETEEDTETEELEAKASCASDDAPALKPEHFVESWNALASRLGKPKVRDLTPERRTKLKARIAGYSVDDFRAVLSGVERSPFLRGEKGWSGCTFDWITKKGNFQKVLEGNYDG